MNSARFTDMKQVSEEKERLRRLNHQHAIRAKDLARDLSRPKTLGGLLKNSILGSRGVRTDNGVDSTSDLVVRAAEIGGLLLGTKFLAKRGKWLQVTSLLLPFLFRNGVPSMNRVSEELKVSAERLKRYWEQRHATTDEQHSMP